MSDLLEMTFTEPKAEKITASGHALDLSRDKVGALRDSSDVAFDSVRLRERMAEDGYLYLPNLLNREEVMEARRIVANQLMAEGHLEVGTNPMDCIAAKDAKMAFRPDVTKDNPALMKVLYDGPMMAFYERFLGCEVRHFDFTWFRAISPGGATFPHTDAVYMNRGTQNLYTSWTPIGDVTTEIGGLMVLEGSHKHQKLRENYSTRDVDAFCENKVGKDFTGMGGGGNIREGGYLSNNPVTLRDAIGGRWLTANFHMGDLLMFSIYTVHASIDNRSNQIRLSSDSRYQSAAEPADERWIGPNPTRHGSESKRAMIC